MKRSFAGWLWLVSGVPVGVALILLPPPALFVCFALFVLLETGHSLSPIVLAWTDRTFRQQVMYEQPYKFMLWPALVFVSALTIGSATQLGFTSYRLDLPHQLDRLTDVSNPFPMMVWLYSVWNVYHFAMQDFGVLIMWSGRGHRGLKLFACLAGFPLLYFATKLAGIPWLSLAMVGVISVNHWVTDIGLSGYRKQSWLFVAVLLLAGAIGFIWMVPTSNGPLIRAIPVIIAARLGLSFVHFLYSGWIWKFSDPRVRATIGKERFA